MDVWTWSETQSLGYSFLGHPSRFSTSLGFAFHLYAVGPPLGDWCLRLLELSDLTQVGLPPRSHEDLLQVLDKRHLVRTWGVKPGEGQDDGSRLKCHR